MSGNRIEIKDVTPNQFNPKTHKNNSDRFNPNNGIYVRKSQGTFQTLRRNGSWLLLLLFGLTPWLSYDNHQAILLDFWNQKFYFFGTTLFPQDFTLLAVLFIIAAFGLFFITTFLGRVWCGYLCPQTVWTFMFIWFEEKLEGSANKRRKQDKLPLTTSLAIRKTAKHLAWGLISLVTGLTFTGYFFPIKDLLIDFVTVQASFWSGFWILFFAFCTYINAGWMRSIVCIHMCPYARFQSAMFDKDTYIVGYDTVRGDKRGPRSKKANLTELNLGDCIDCNLCVEVCPTGIDIRDGLQYECINCGACIDACDNTMEKMGYPKGLIKYTTEHQQLGNKSKIFRPKLIGYAAILLLMVGLFISQIMTISPMRLDVLRDRTQLFKINSQGQIENTYTLKVFNKTQQPQTYLLSVTGLPNNRWYGPRSVDVQPGEVLSVPISLGIHFKAITKPVSEIMFKMQDNKHTTTHSESRFLNIIK